MDNDDKCGDDNNDDESDDGCLLIWVTLKVIDKTNEHHVPYVFMVMDDDE